MNLRSLENGTHPACGRSAVRRERSRPSRAAASKMARSTGSMPAPGALACAGARLAISAWPIMPRVASVACAGPPDGSELSWPAVHVRTTAMSPDVRVRVLSVQMTVVDPSDSTAGRRRTSAFRAAIRCRPTASAIVATAGSASGTAATASAIPVSITMSRGTRCRAARPATIAATPSASQTRTRPSASRRRSSGVGSSSTPAASSPIRPTSVAGPVATTTARPTPEVIVVPA